MEAAIHALFERYERYFNQAIQGEANIDEIVLVYASEFIAATSNGVMASKNDENL